MKRLFTGLRGKPPERSYDAVIIGAGIGGLICANLLAREGLRVLLVEQHYMVGGYCSTFRRKGFTFDAATHFYPLLGNPATITGKLLRDLGVTNAWVKMDPVDHFHFPDGSTFSVPADFNTYLSKLKQEFPQEVESLDRFFVLVRQVYLSGLLTYFRWRETDRLDQRWQMTVRQVLDEHFRDPKLKLLLAADCGHWGSPPSRTSFVFDSMLRLSYFLGNYYPCGGSQAFADELALRFEELGGHILMSSNVNRIIVRDKSACGVEINSGSAHSQQMHSVNAGVVISNADLLLTLERLIEPNHLESGRIASIRRLRPTHPCFLVHIGLKGIATEELRAAHGYHWDSWDSDRVATNSFKIFVPTLYEPAMAPPGSHIVIVQKLTDIDYDSIDDWATHKAKVEAYIMQNLERVMPGFTRKVVVKLSASALTSHRFTLNHKGAMLGWEMSPDQLGDHRPALNGMLKNLYFVGHWTQPGGGITPVIVSAMQVAKKITGRESRFPTQYAEGVGQFQPQYAEGVGQFQPRVGACDNPGTKNTNELQTLKALGLCGANPFRVQKNGCHIFPRVETTLG
ncbi:MAG TPA: NAD(P)/FAD-dependent oxidoreductase [Pyrinomonadaceae bacterium]|nr:NAD(P)/FAD-dependent oxidoreductase [Pyrinomonadaceae bacterium]